MTKSKTTMNPVPVPDPTAEDLSRLLSASIELEETKKELKTLKRMVKLTDFSLDHLNTLISALSAYMMDQEQHAEHYVKYQLSELDTFKGAYKRSKNHVDNCKDIAIQVLNAIDIVKTRETINAN